MKIAIIGTGYVGLVTGTCFAAKGNEVVCVDIDEAKIAKLNAGKVPIFEPGLDQLFKDSEAHLRFTTDLNEAIPGASVVFLALPTPPGEDGAADLSYVLTAARNIALHLNDNSFTVLVDKSTVPVGTAEKVRDEVRENTSADFGVVSNPEFLREGYAIQDFMEPDRVVLGFDDERAIEIMLKLYSEFVAGDKIIKMDIRSAEMTKYAANAFLAAKITFMNEVANLCERVGANIENVKRGVGSDPRIGERFLNPGIGYGGSCFPKDVLALSKTAEDKGYIFHMLQTVDNVNNAQKGVIIRKLLNWRQNVEGLTFALWGLAFKPNTDDVREAPALVIIQKLIELGANVVAYDPEAEATTRRALGELAGLTYADDMYSALKKCDALVVATEWDVFTKADLDMIKSLLKEPVVFDGRNIFDPETMQTKGFRYESIGRLPVGVGK